MAEVTEHTETPTAEVDLKADLARLRAGFDRDRNPSLATRISHLDRLEDVLMKVATTPASEIASLTPWAWQAARDKAERRAPTAP